MDKKKQSRSWSLVELMFLITAWSIILDFCIASPMAIQSKVCKTSGCLEAAQYVLKNMDETIDPCDNFYQFVCGKFVKEAVIPDADASLTLFSKNTIRLQNKLKQNIEEPSKGDKLQTFKLLKSYYNICLDTEKIENNSINDLRKILSSLGNWPVLMGKSWVQSNFKWQNLNHQLRKIGLSFGSIVSFYIGIDERNTSRNIIILDQADTGLDQKYLLKGLDEKVVQAYYKYMVELAKILGANQKQAEKELAESLKFEIALAKISLTAEDRRNRTKLYNLRTVKELESMYPYISWKDYLNELVSPQYSIELKNEVIVGDLNFLESLSQLLQKTSKRVIANYMMWRVVQRSVYFMNKKFKEAQMDFLAAIEGVTSEGHRWTQCINNAMDSMPLAIGALYVRKNFDAKTKSAAEKLVADLKKSFQNLLQKADWIDKETRKTAEEKLNAIESEVAYPDEFFDNAKLEEYYQNLELDNDSFINSQLKLNLFETAKVVEQLKKPVIKAYWIRHGRVALVNAAYYFAENSIEIPAGILQREFFNTARPNYMNYGAVGWIIGHELTHGFDDQGSLYDKNGSLVNWWHPETRKEYLKRAQCIIDQYNNYRVKEVGLNVNGRNTQGENIADNGGIKEAYYAYEEFERQNGEEPRLQGLPYSPRQMFWISAANNWCQKYRYESLKDRVITNVHSPGDFRVIGSLSNMPEFAKDFECPLGSPMNPIKKCSVW